METQTQEGYIDKETSQWVGPIDGFEKEDPKEELDPIWQMDFEDLKKYKDILTQDEYLELLYQNYPSTWMEENLFDPNNHEEKLNVRWYQREMINCKNPLRIVRAGRQLGKSLTIRLLIAFFGFKRKNSRILVIGPQKSHVEQIFDELLELLSYTPELNSRIKSKRQPMQITFHLEDGSVNKALFMTTGEDSGGKALAVRGKTANVLLIDEADYINDTAIQDVVIPTTNAYENPFIWMSSTPTGRKGHFRNSWDSGYYSTFHYTSHVSPTWTKKKDQLARHEKTKMGYLHEIMAEWGSDEEGVFNRDDMKTCTDMSKILFEEENQEGIKRQYKTTDDEEYLDNIIEPKCRILGVDWNKSTNGTRLVWCDFDKNHNIWFRNKWKIDDKEFTQNVAMNKIIELHARLKFDYIFVDVGYGGVQIEDLHLYGLKNKHTKLHEIVKAVQTDSQIEIDDIATGDKRKTYVKNFIVESTVRFLEQHRIRIAEEENISKSKDAITIFDQMVNFYIKRRTPNGRPVYACDAKDHDLDAFMFTIYGYLIEVIKTNKLWDKLPTAKPRGMSREKMLDIQINRTKDDNERKSEKQSNPTYVNKGYTKRTINRQDINTVNRFGFGRRRGRRGISRRINR